MKKLYTLSLFVCITLVSNAQLLDNYDISTSSNGVIAMPSGLPAVYSSFVKYTKIQAPNGQAIHFIAQNAITDAQIVRARNILQFYLTNVPGSQYGADKTVVTNKMGTNEAILMLLNGSDTGNPPAINGQPLYQNEMAVEGHTWYINNDYSHRDASFEEILHLMHDMGIGVDTNGTPSTIGALPAYQTEIRAAQDNADNSFAIWPLGATSDPSWYNQLSNENSLSQEYLAAVVDSYYGLWEAWNDSNNPSSATTGMWGEYLAKTRAEIQTEDPMGWALLPKYFSPYININMDIDPTFTGVFDMNRNTSLPYTYKSQYLQHLTLTGTNASGIKGNDLNNNLNGNTANNTLEGGKGNDTLDGKAGTDTSIFTGNRSEYTITVNGSTITVQDNTANRDGTDTLTNIEALQFADQTVQTSTLSIEDFELAKSVIMFPNPSNNKVTFQLKNIDFKSLEVSIFDIRGRELKKIYYTQKNIEINTKSFARGLYFVQLRRDNRAAVLNKKLVLK